MSTKQEQLVQSIVDGITQSLNPSLEELRFNIAEFKAQITVDIAAMGARLEVMELNASKGVRAAKTQGRAGGKSGGKTATDCERWDKAKNAMLWLRLAWAFKPELVSAMVTDKMVKQFDTENSITKKEGDDRKFAEGVYLWKKVFTGTQQDEVRTLFKAWKAEREKGAREPQLAADTVAPVTESAAPDP